MKVEDRNRGKMASNKLHILSMPVSKPSEKL